ncbi:hypothetical protein D9M72_220330 [compost metagenome]
MAVGGDQVVGRHLVAVPDHAVDDGLHLALVHATLHHHVARQHHAHVARVFVQQVDAVADELVDVAVIVGQEDPRLHVAPVTAGVMHQAAQGEVHPCRIEQRQGHVLEIVPVVQAISHAITGGGQVGAGEDPRQFGSGDAGAGQFIALLDHVGIRDILLAYPHFDGDGEVLHERSQLVQQVTAKVFRLGHGDAVGAWHLHLGVGAHGARHLALAVVGDTQFGIAEQFALGGAGQGAFLEIALQCLAQRIGSAMVEGGKARNSLFGGGGDDEFIERRAAHGLLPGRGTRSYLAPWM